MNYPIVHGSVKGWRYWGVAKQRKRFVLQAVAGGDLWLPGQKTKAHCRKAQCSYHPKEEKGKLAESGICGLYAYKTRKIAQGKCLDYFGCILGRVALWGDTVPHERGFRSEFGRPLELHEAVCAACGRFIPLSQGSLIRGGLWSFISCFPHFNTARKVIVNRVSSFDLMIHVAMLIILYLLPLQMLRGLLSAENLPVFIMWLLGSLTVLLVVAVINFGIKELSFGNLALTILKYVKNLFLWNRYTVICSRHIGKERGDRLLGLSARYYLQLKDAKNNVV